MSSELSEYDELRVQIERARALLEGLVVRGLRACGPDELSQLGSFAEHLDKTGAGHVASRLYELRSQIESDERTSARQLLETQTNVRLLERLLTLRVVKEQYAVAAATPEQFDSLVGINGDNGEDSEGDEDETEEG
ncbi:MAG TPA: hypothetical protein VHU84_09995 [Lacipirellulaceae bacterium]|jgi:hypothetical protein|nr:hypothetical protein [Lacipirellulaceae bacterium]